MDLSVGETTVTGDGAEPDGGTPGPGRTDGQVTGGRGDFWRAAATPRMIGIFVLLFAAALVCIRLGAWQLDRAALRGASEAEAAHAERIAEDPVPLEDVLRAQTSFTTAELARPVSVTGSFDPGQQLLVPGRSVAGQDAVLVITALRVGEGPDTGAMLPVLRGWVPADSITTDGAAAAPVDAATARRLGVPTGEQRVTGHLGGSEVGDPASYPTGMTGAISTAALANLWGGPTFSGYLVEFSEAADGTRLPAGPSGLPHASPPTSAVESGLNIQNLAYALEWVIFAGFAMFIWWRMVRDEVRYRREEAGLA
ncbi:MAG: SURF1 family protein [Georgenia sp.]